jgi:hypothetical protein
MEAEMASSCRTESKLLTHEELQMVRLTHHPAIYEPDLKELTAIQGRLRNERAKLRTLVNRSRRVHRGKPDARDDKAPANAQHLAERKQIFAKALRRVSKEIKRQQKFAANAALQASAQRALASRRANFVGFEGAGQTAGEGMRSTPSTRRRKTVPESKVGSISQATKVAQAVRDTMRGAAKA